MRSSLSHALLLTCGIAFVALPVAGVDARSTRVAHGFVQVELPGSWKLKRGTVLVATAEDGASQVLFVEPVQARENAAAFMQRGVRGFEKNRKVLKTHPAAPATGRTRAGQPLTFWSLTSQGPGGDMRYAAYYVFASAGRYQTVIFLTGDENSFKSRMKPLARALERAQVSGGGGPTAVAGQSSGGGPITPLRGRAHANYNYRMNIPSGWKPEKGRIGGETRFKFNAKAAGFQTQGGKHDLRATIEVQPVAARDPSAALVSFLTNRADLGLHRYRIHKIRSWRKAEGRAGNLASGRYAGVVLDFQKDNRILLAGAALVNPANDTTLLVGTGMLISEYDVKYKVPNTAADRAAWSSLYGKLLGMAASVRWAATPARDPGREAWLAQKRTLRFNKSRSVSSSSTGAFFSTQAAWDFASDGSVKYKIDRTRSFVDNSYDLYGRPDYSSGYGGSGKSRSARYEVRRQGRRYFLGVIYPSGAGSLHNIDFAPFAIDGMRDGCCS